MRGVGALIDSGAFTNGPVVSSFEVAFAAFCGVDHCVGVSSGLDALRIGLACQRVFEPGRRGDRPGRDVVATLEAVSAGGR